MHFHPAFGYEDFIEGYRPQKSAGGQLIFEKRDGIFKKLCRDAAASDEKFVLLIDEINRGDIPRIFGELLTLARKEQTWAGGHSAFVWRHVLSASKCPRHRHDEHRGSFYRFA